MGNPGPTGRGYFMINNSSESQPLGAIAQVSSPVFASHIPERVITGRGYFMINYSSESQPIGAIAQVSSPVFTGHIPERVTTPSG